MTKGRAVIDATAEQERLPKKDLCFRFALAVAVVFCLGCCTLFLMIPTESINVDTVYQGF